MYIQVIYPKFGGKLEFLRSETIYLLSDYFYLDVKKRVGYLESIDEIRN